MNRFVRNVSLFTLSLICFIALTNLVAEKIINRRAVFPINPATRYIVLGHSHPQCAFNDSLINNFQNLAAAAEPYFYSTIKLRKIFQHENHIQVVLIEFSNNQLYKHIINQWIWGKQNLYYKYKIFSPFLSFKERKYLFKRNIGNLPSVYFNSYFHNFARLVRFDYDYRQNMGGYLFLVRDKTDSLLKNAKRSLDSDTSFNSQ